MTQQAVDNIIRWREDPVAFVREVFGVEPDPWQHDLLTAFADPSVQRICLGAAKGPGKSCGLAWVGWNFLLTRPFPKVICTSITADNLADNLWTEFAKWQQKSEILSTAFTWTKARIFSNESPKTWWATAATWAKNANPQEQAEALAGYHADYILFLLDESGGYPEAVMTTAEAGLAAGIECRIVQAGNKTQLSGPLYNAHTRDRKIWHVIGISGDPDDPNRSPRIDINYAREMIDRYGRDNDWVKINILSEFPSMAENQLLSPEDVSKAMQRKAKETDTFHAERRIGVDIARFGPDMTIIAKRQGLQAHPMIEIPQGDTQTILGRVMHERREFRSEQECLDAGGGYHVGLEDALIAAGAAPIAIHSSTRANDEVKFTNRRAEMWYEMAQWIKRGGCLPDDPALARELVGPTYKYDRRGRIQLESKDEIKKRLNYSPDRADALALTFAIPEYRPELPEGTIPELWNLPGVRPKPDVEFAEREWNPLSRD